MSGECRLLIEGEERQLKAWDFVHCPPWTEHVFVGAGDGPCVIVMVGARKPERSILYPVNAVARRHDAGVHRKHDTGRRTLVFPGPPRLDTRKDGCRNHPFPRPS